MKKILINIFIIIQAIYAAYGANITIIEDLNYTDQSFMKLYRSTVDSKNRLIKKTRLQEYPVPNFYLYILKKGEDIWTIIAKTSLNIDTIATLNRIDFIGDLIEGKNVILPDLLGVFSEDLDYLQDKYPELAEEIISIDDPLSDETLNQIGKVSTLQGTQPGGQPTSSMQPSNKVIAKTQRPNDQFNDQLLKKKIYFLPEVKLDFIEVAYIRGVVFHHPLSGIESSGFGIRKDPFINEITFHGGVDIAAAEGKPVRAARWGKVVHAGPLGGYGNTVVIKHELGYMSLYGHLKDIVVEVGQNVETGELIGTVGSTGKSTGPHLHFEIRRGKDKLNPENIPFFFIHK